jgi:tetratricopeptide (TPR) repeat protein
MPYFAGVTLAELFDRLRRIPPWRRTACDWRDVLARAQSESPFAAPASNQARTALPNHYPDIVCRIGICLADAAQYAHDRGLLHLDIKPSNVLIAADGLPMLLDFHLARGRLLEGDAAPPWFGGTPGYMSPEQASAFRAAHNGQLIPHSIDERSDLYSLGVVLYEMLAGTVRADAEAAAPTVRIGQESNALAERAPWRPVRLTQLNPQVSVGLADIIHKCLAQNPAERYPNMAAFGADLRRHLANVPLRGVRNRSLAERWRKWRRRRPHGMALAAMMLLMLMVVGALAVGAMRHIADRVDQAEAALVQAQEQLGRRDWQAASATLHRGLAAVRGLPGTWSVAGELQQSLQIATAGWQHEDRSAATQELHELAERARGLYGATNLPAGIRDDLAANCGDFWHRKAEVAERLQPLTPPIRADLVDLAVFWANLQNLMSTPSESPVAILSDAERLFGSCSVLSTERRLHGASAEDSVAEAADGPIAWQHFALARAYLRAGDLQRASDEANQALRAEPQGMWPNFYFGLCAQARRHHSEAVAAFGVCIGASPQSGACFCNRGIAFAALGLTDAALRDFDQALRLDPTLATAALERARLQVRAGRFTEALADFERAAALGADAALSPPEAAIVYYERGDITAALGALFQKHKANLNLSNSAPPFSAKSR